MINQKSKIKGVLKTFYFLPVFLTFNLLLFTFPSPVSAHVLKSDGNIGAVLHIDPDDDPIVGSPAGFFFEFKDKQNRFTPQNCDCTFSVTEDGKQLFSRPLFQNSQNPSLENSSVFFTFPERNVYQVKVSGTPNTPGAFQSFTLTYDVRVAREAPNQSANPSQTAGQPAPSWISTHIPHLIGGAIVGIFLILALIKQLTKKPNV